MDALVCERFRELLASDDVLILVHRNADGDCLGTAFALKQMLQNAGKRACVAASGVIDRNLRFITGGASELRVQFLPSVIVTVDVAAQKLLGPELESYADSVDFNIDHHVTNTEYARCNLIFGDASSAGEVLFDLAEACGVTLDEIAAAHLYTAIAFDTGCFRYSNTTAHTHEVAARLMRFPINTARIVQEMFDTIPLRQMRMEAAAIRNLHSHLGGKVLLAPISRLMLEENGALDEDVSGFVSVVRRVEGSVVCGTLKETREGDVKVSLRASDDLFDASAVAGAFGGGGHKKASGCMIKADLSAAEDLLLAEIKKEWARVFPDDKIQ